MFRMALSIFLLALPSSARLANEPDPGHRGLIFDFLFNFFFPQHNNPGSTTKTFKVSMTNLAYMQPIAPTFVLVHNKDATPVFTLGGVASPGLKELAENGGPDILVSEYTNANGVKSATGEGSPIGFGASREFMITVDGDFPFFSMAASKCSALAFTVVSCC